MLSKPKSIVEVLNTVCVQIELDSRLLDRGPKKGLSKATLCGTGRFRVRVKLQRVAWVLSDTFRIWFDRWDAHKAPSSRAVCYRSSFATLGMLIVHYIEDPVSSTHISRVQTSSYFNDSCRRPNTFTSIVHRDESVYVVISASCLVRE